MAFDIAGSSWIARLSDGHHTWRLDGVRSPAGVGIVAPATAVPTEVVSALVRGFDVRGWGAAMVTLTEPVPAAVLDVWCAHGFVVHTRQIEVERDLGDLPVGPSPFDLRPFSDDPDTAARLLVEVCRGAALLDGAPPDHVVAHFLALGGPDTSGWTVAWHDGRPAGLFLIGGGGEGDLWRIGLAGWARGRGWGTILHRHALEALRRRGAARYRDATPTDSVAMGRIFARHGCVEVARFVELVRPAGARSPSRDVPLSAAPVWADVRPPPPAGFSQAALARALARTIFAFLLDHPGQAPIVLDVRPGSGVRAARVLAQLDRLLATHPYEVPPLRYVLCTRGTPEGTPWSDVPELERWFRSGRLDRAAFDPRTDRVLHLDVAGEAVVPDGARPILAVACERFATLPHDVWRLGPEGPGPLWVGDGGWVAGEPSVPAVYDELGASLVVWSHAGKLPDGDLLVPIGAAAWLDACATWAGGRLVVLSAEPGTRTVSELAGRRLGEVPSRAPSLPVDHAALSLMVSAAGGKVTLAPGGDGVSVAAAFVWGEVASFAQTLNAWRQAFVEACPLRANLAPPPPGADVGSLVDVLARMTLAADDPELFFAFADTIRARLPEAPAVERQAVHGLVRRVEAQVSWCRDAPDVPFALGLVLHALGLYADADTALQTSEQARGPTVATRTNRGLCRWALGDVPGATALFEDVLVRRPGEPTATACLASLRGQSP